MSEFQSVSDNESDTSSFFESDASSFELEITNETEFKSNRKLSLEAKVLTFDPRKAEIIPNGSYSAKNGHSEKFSHGGDIITLQLVPEEAEDLSKTKTLTESPSPPPLEIPEKLEKNYSEIIKAKAEISESLPTTSPEKLHTETTECKSLSTEPKSTVETTLTDNLEYQSINENPVITEVVKKVSENGNSSAGDSKTSEVNGRQETIVNGTNEEDSSQSNFLQPEELIEKTILVAVEVIQENINNDKKMFLETEKDGTNKAEAVLVETMTTKNDKNTDLDKETISAVQPALPEIAADDAANKHDLKNDSPQSPTTDNQNEPVNNKSPAEVVVPNDLSSHESTDSKKIDFSAKETSEVSKSTEKIKTRKTSQELNPDHYSSASSGSLDKQHKEISAPRVATQFPHKIAEESTVVLGEETKPATTSNNNYAHEICLGNLQERQSRNTMKTPIGAKLMNLLENEQPQNFMNHRSSPKVTFAESPITVHKISHESKTVVPKDKSTFTQMNENRKNLIGAGNYRKKDHGDPKKQREQSYDIISQERNFPKPEQRQRKVPKGILPKSRGNFRMLQRQDTGPNIEALVTLGPYDDRPKEWESFSSEKSFKVNDIIQFFEAKIKNARRSSITKLLEFGKKFTNGKNNSGRLNDYSSLLVYDDRDPDFDDDFEMDSDSSLRMSPVSPDPELQELFSSEDESKKTGLKNGGVYLNSSEEPLYYPRKIEGNFSETFTFADSSSASNWFKTIVAVHCLLCVAYLAKMLLSEIEMFEESLMFTFGLGTFGVALNFALHLLIDPQLCGKRNGKLLDILQILLCPSLILAPGIPGSSSFPLPVPRKRKLSTETVDSGYPATPESFVTQDNEAEEVEFVIQLNNDSQKRSLRFLWFILTLQVCIISVPVILWNESFIISYLVNGPLQQILVTKFLYIKIAIQQCFQQLLKKKSS